MSDTAWSDVAEQLDQLPAVIDVELNSHLEWDIGTLQPRRVWDCDCIDPQEQGCPSRITWVDRCGLEPLTWPVGTYSIATRQPLKSGWSSYTVTHDDPADEDIGLDTVQWRSCGIGNLEPQYQPGVVYRDLVDAIEEMLAWAANERIRDRRSSEQRQLAERVAAYAKRFRYVGDDDAVEIADVAVGDIRHDLTEVAS